MSNIINKRKRNEDFEFITDIVNKLNISEENDIFDELIQEMTFSELKTPCEEYLILFESKKYVYNEKTIDKFLYDNLNRFKRYNYKVNFEENDRIAISIEYYIKNYKTLSKVESIELIKKIDLMIIETINKLDNENKKRKYNHNESETDDDFLKKLKNWKFIQKYSFYTSFTTTPTTLMSTFMKTNYLKINTNLIQTNIYSELKTMSSTPISKPSSSSSSTPKTNDIHDIYELYRNHIDFDSYIKSIDELLVNINELQDIEKNIFLDFSQQIKKNNIEKYNIEKYNIEKYNIEKYNIEKNIFLDFSQQIKKNDKKI